MMPQYDLGHKKNPKGGEQKAQIVEKWWSQKFKVGTKSMSEKRVNQ